MTDEPKTEDQITDAVTAPSITEDVAAEPAAEPAAKAAAAPKAAKTKRPVIFESREREPLMFDVAGIRPTRNYSTGRLEWEVAADDVERFEQNHFVQLCRVVRKAV